MHYKINTEMDLVEHVERGLDEDATRCYPHGWAFETENGGRMLESFLNAGLHDSERYTINKSDTTG